jgi:hypothetical protein
MPCRSGAIGATKYCGQHTDIVLPQGHEYPVSVKRVDTVETLRFYASKPNSPAFYAEVADELEKLRAENKRLNKLNKPKR